MHKGRQFDSYTEKIHVASNHRLGRKHGAGNPATWLRISEGSEKVRAVAFESYIPRSMLRFYIGERRSGFVFESGNGTMLWPSKVYRDGLSPVLQAMGRNCVRFHAFRRFREATLQRSEVRQILIDYWMGHESGDMSSRYGKQLTEDAEFRQQWSERVGLGFELPSFSEPSVVCATCATNPATETVVA